MRAVRLGTRDILANAASMKVGRFVLTLALFLTLAAARASAATPPPPHLTLVPCRYAGTAARCGTLNVWEDRGKFTGRTVPLRVVVLPAIASKPGLPLYPLAGGPGQGMVELGAQIMESGFFRRAHTTHDIVFVDQRGTGASHPLRCDFFPTATSMLRELFPLDRVRACRDELAREANLTMYGSGNAADDLDDVARALGHDKIVVFGGSYGTTLGLVYLRRHPARVAAEILESVAPPWLRLPLPFPRGAQRALDDVAAACDAERFCHSRYPAFRKEFDVLAAASEGGLPVDYVDARSHERVKGVISHEVFADRMRQALYAEETAAVLPAVVHAAVAGHDTAPFARLVVLVTRGIEGDLAMGLNLSVTCSESLPFVTPEEAQSESRDTFMRESRYRAQRAACGVWDVPGENRHFLDPIPSPVPVLMISGEDDPATPPQFGAEELRYLPNGRQITIPGAGHFVEGTCVERLESAVLEGSAPKSLDASCVRKAHRPPFYAKVPSWLR